ncbi:TlpA disulfide reductase family protein [Chitinolyticbacter albus]|uniref:TlpA disulfide reductase family protein n=1 Tax=Chitinolyticbacter albus TaxID=2961951 RepID=UPI00210BDB2C|nr:TlpA disulfide reductase family protein [Chitinolyticbacter albus]
MTTKTKLALALGLLVMAIAGYALWHSQRPVVPIASYTTLDGRSGSISGLRGKVVLVNFWATSCPGCMQEMPDLMRVHQKFKPQGYETLAVAMSYDVPVYIRTYRQRAQLPFVVTHDQSGAIATAFGDVTLTPTSFLLDKRGAVIKKYVGVPDMAELEAQIGKALRAS